MRLIYFVVITLGVIVNDVYSAEAGMPQLDPKYWASQAFWLLIIFSLLYLSVSKFFIPMIKNNLDDRERKIKDCLDDAKHLDGKYTVFGYLVEGDHVLNTIIKLGTEHSTAIMLSKPIIPDVTFFDIKRIVFSLSLLYSLTVSNCSIAKLAG